MSFLGIILFPFSVIYDLATRFRNYLFNVGIKGSFEFDANVIGVGNLTVGGTGKSPMIEYLVKVIMHFQLGMNRTNFTINLKTLP
jgi:tetraacyldisaccharide 4'-kinase